MKKMLIVDDDEVVLKLLTKVFSKEKFDITTAVNGMEAVKLCTKKKFDVILLDIVMPVLDGIEATKAIKISQPDVKIIVVTGNATDEQMEEIKQFDITDLIEKPFSVDVLKEKVNEALG